ncbi:hypothetical protein HYV81_05365 [Candidatus Woesearchaeota archaeon]|nr:hypothetical protein [Candidatus Woesearchaeota archaeon]
MISKKRAYFKRLLMLLKIHGFKTPCFSMNFQSRKLAYQSRGAIKTPAFKLGIAPSGKFALFKNAHCFQVFSGVALELFTCAKPVPEIFISSSHFFFQKEFM